MLGRRRHVSQRSRPTTHVAPAATTATSSPGQTLPVPDSRLHALAIAERLEAFTPAPLPSLTNTVLTDESGVEVGNESISFSPRPIVRLSSAVLLLYLNVGCDPPDFPRIDPCAKLECWMDPTASPIFSSHLKDSASTWSEAIAEGLEKQYQALFSMKELNVTRSVERSIEVSQSRLVKARRVAGQGRVLVHYNGHGMPRATELGEVWMFDAEHMHYIPFNVADAAHLANSPTTYVLDCNSAGAVLHRWYRDRLHVTHPNDYFLCACSTGETLPLSPALPADLLTSCLTTPLKTALEWYIGYSQHHVLLPQVTEEMIRNMAEDVSDRRSPRGELHWILNAVMDSIAWCSLPPAQFHALFRGDSSTRVLFRNAFLADRLLREVGCTPVTHPPLPEDAHLNFMWDLWDYTLEKVISQLPRLAASGGTVAYEPTTFFDDQLTAFEMWVNSGDVGQWPKQLPCVLMAITQLAYRTRAMALVVKYLDTGKTAGKRAILCGVLPYMSRLLTQSAEVSLIATVLWMQIIRIDPAEGCRELQRCECEQHLTQILLLEDPAVNVVTIGEDGKHPPLSKSTTTPPPQGHPNDPPRPAPTVHGSSHSSSSRSSSSGTSTSDDDDGDHQPQQPISTVQDLPTPEVVADAKPTYFLLKSLTLERCKCVTCYVLCQLLRCGVQQCVLCWNCNLLNIGFRALSSASAEHRSWSCLLLSHLFSGLRHARTFASRESTSRVDLFTRLLQDRSPIVRSSCVTLLASIIGSRPDMLPQDQQVRRMQMEMSLLIKLRGYLFDASMSVREELIYFCTKVIFRYRYALRTSLEEFLGEIARLPMGSPWSLNEPEVQVKSLLHAARPTTTARFDDTVVFHVTKLSEDDPAPPPEERCSVTAIHPTAMEIILGLLHDAALMLETLRNSCDEKKVAIAIQSLVSGEVPQSQRLEQESVRTMSTAASMEDEECQMVSEAERACRTWNADMMAKLVLDMHGRRLEPHSPVVEAELREDGGFQSSITEPPRTRTSTATSPLGAVTSTATNSVGATRSLHRAQTTGVNFPFLRHQVLPSMVRPDTIVCTALRALDASMVVATMSQSILNISYDSFEYLEVLNTFPVRLSAPVHQLLLINDLSDQSGLLMLDKRGAFSLMKNWCGRGAAPEEAAVFAACPPPPPNTTIDLKAAFRTNTATLFYGGPIGPDGATEIHALSLAEEQVAQRLPVSGDPRLTTLEVHTVHRAVLAGFADGVVRYYDDRQQQGQVGAMGMLQCRSGGLAGRSSSSGSSSFDPVLGVGAIANSSSSFGIFACTARTMHIFDTRKLSEPCVMVDHTELYSGILGDVTAPRIVGCSSSAHTGLVALSFTNGTYAAYNTRGSILTQTPQTVAHGSNALMLHPKSCVAHPLRPLMTCGGEVLCVQP